MTVVLPRNASVRLVERLHAATGRLNARTIRARDLGDLVRCLERTASRARRIAPPPRKGR